MRWLLAPVKRWLKHWTGGGDPEESEVVFFGGQRVATRIGQIGVQEKSSLIQQAPLPDSKLLPGGFVPIHAVYGAQRPSQGAQCIVPRHPVDNLRHIRATPGVDGA